MAREVYTTERRESDQSEVAETLLDAVRVYECFTGQIIDPSNPNARDEFRRVAAQKAFGARSYGDLWRPYRKVVDGIVDALILKLSARFQAVSAR